MGNNNSKYREEILKLRDEGKKYREICEILSCTMSIVGYHLTYYKQMKEKRKTSELKVYVKKVRKDTKKRNREIVVEYLKQHPCVDCNNSDLRVLDFDHVRGIKVNSVANGVKQAWSIKKLLNEIDKCEVRCSNCHRIVTHERRVNKNNNN